MVQCAEGTHTKTSLTFQDLDDIPLYEVYQVSENGENGVLQAGEVVWRSGAGCLNIARNFVRLDGIQCKEALKGAAFRKVEF